MSDNDLSPYLPLSSPLTLLTRWMRDAADGRSIIWQPFKGAPSEGGHLRITQRGIEIRFHTEARNAKGRNDVEYVAAHEIAHAIVKLRGNGVYVDSALIDTEALQGERKKIPLIVSVLEHPHVHRVMRDAGIRTEGIQDDDISRLLQMESLQHFVGMEQRLETFEAFGAAVDLIGFMTAFRGAGSNDAMERIADEAPDFANCVTRAVSAVEAFFKGGIASNEASERVAIALGNPQLARYFVTFDKWAASLSTSK